MSTPEQAIDASADVENRIASPGKILAKAREEQGLTQQQVADKLHLRISSIFAVETDSLEEGVSATFTKGYVRLYAKLMDLEVEPLLKAYDKVHAEEQQPTKLQSFSRRVSREANDQRWNLVSYIVVLLVLGSLVAWWVQQSGFLGANSAFNNSDVSQSDVANNDAKESFEEPILQTSSSDKTGPQITETQVRDEQLKGSTSVDPINESKDSNDSNESVVTESALNNNSTAFTSDSGIDDTTSSDQLDAQDISLNARSNLGEELNDSLSQGVAEEDTSLNDLSNNAQDLADSAGDVASASNNDLSDIQALDNGLQNTSQFDENGMAELVFTFKDDCWVSVKDSEEELMAIGVKVKGRVMTVSGVPPIRVILGAPQNVEINYAGQDVDMTVFPAGQSANFLLPVESE